MNTFAKIPKLYDVLLSDYDFNSLNIKPKPNDTIDKPKNSNSAANSSQMSFNDINENLNSYYDDNVFRFVKEMNIQAAKLGMRET